MTQPSSTDREFGVHYGNPFSVFPRPEPNQGNGRRNPQLGRSPGVVHRRR